MSRAQTIEEDITHFPPAPSDHKIDNTSSSSSRSLSPTCEVSNLMNNLLLETTTTEMTRKKRKKSANISSSAIFPNLIIEEILLRLPVKSLLRFRCVHKTWFYLVSDPSFINMHFNRSVERDNIRILLELIYPKCTKYTLDPENPNQAETIGDGSSYYLGSCDGFVFLRSRDRCGTMTLLNPSTRKHATVVLPGYDLRDPKVLCDFFYDVLSCKYKLLIFNSNYENKKIDSSLVKICTVGTYNVKKFGNIPYKNIFRSSAKLPNGAIHWLATKCISGLDSVEQVILAFGPPYEDFVEVPQPEIDGHSDGNRPQVILSELAGCLSIVHHHRTELVVWQMKKYGIKNSWTKLFVVVHPSVVLHYPVKPLCVTKKGDLVLLIVEQGLFLYGHEQKTLEEIKVAEEDRELGTYKKIVEPFLAITHVDSLLEFQVSNGRRGQVVGREPPKLSYIHPRQKNERGHLSMHANSLSNHATSSNYPETYFAIVTRD